MRLIFSLFLAAACVSPEHAELKSMRPAYSKAIQERDLYKALADKAQLHLLAAVRRADAAYEKGIRDGHAQVACSASWPTVQTQRSKDGAYRSVVLTPKPKVEPKKAFCKPHRGMGPLQPWECRP